MSLHLYQIHVEEQNRPPEKKFSCIKKIDGMINLLLLFVPDFLSSSLFLLLYDLVSSERPNI